MLNQKGGHQKWRHGNGRQVIVALHGKAIPTGTLERASSKAASLTADDFPLEPRAKPGWKEMRYGHADMLEATFGWRPGTGSRDRAGFSLRR